MARGDLVVFEEAKAYMVDGGWEAADVIKVGLADNTLAPTAADAAPVFGDYTEMETAGSYPVGGDTLDTLANCVAEAAGVMTFDDTGASVTWAQHANNGVDAHWAIVYNDTQADLCICYIDLGGPVDMTAGDLTITWHASGMFTIT